MYDYGLSTLEQYQLTAAKSSRTRGALLCHTEKGSFIVKECYRPERKLLMQQKLLQNINEAGYLVDQYLENQEGNLITKDRDGIPYTLQYWYEGKECDTRSKEELIKSFSHLAKLHNVMKLDPVADYTGKSLVDEFARHNQELRKIRRFIRKKGPVSTYEKDFFYSAEWFIEKAEDALLKLQESSYTKIREEAISQGCVCHGEYNQHNVWITKKGIMVTNFNHWGFDLQIGDLYRFLRKIMEKYNWDVELAGELLSAYQKYKTITKDEWEYLRIRFSYPEKYWKLANHYYTHNKAWISEKNVEKMRAVIQQKEQWISFSDSCFEQFQI